MIPRKELIVKKFTGGGRVDGKWIDGTPNNSTFYASVQPLKQKEIEFLPEGRRNAGESYKLYCDLNTDLNIMKDNEQTDIVEIYNENFEVISKEVWNNALIPHEKYIVVRKTDK